MSDYPSDDLREDWRMDALCEDDYWERGLVRRAVDWARANPAPQDPELAVLKRVHAQHLHDAAGAMREAKAMVAEAERQRDEARERTERISANMNASYRALKERRDAAQAEVAALREALERIANQIAPGWDPNNAVAIARKALAAHPQPTPTTSAPEEPTR